MRFAILLLVGILGGCHDAEPFGQCEEPLTLPTLY